MMMGGTFYFMILSCFIGIINGSENSRVRDGKLFPVFQLIRFPNQPCNTGGSKNGTCYTSEECSSRGGSSIGSCASGFGVCCTCKKLFLIYYRRLKKTSNFSNIFFSHCRMWSNNQ